MKVTIPVKAARPNWELLAILRFVLAVIVVDSHIGPPFGALGHAFFGYVAVWCFFLISGYSIAASLDRNAGGFYMRRVERLAPCYYVGLAAALGVYAVLPLAQPTGFYPEFPTALQLAVSLVMMGGVFATPLPVNGSFWSLGLEVVYYAIAPKLRSARVFFSVMLVSVLALLFGANLIEPDPNSSTTQQLLLNTSRMIALFSIWGAGWAIYTYRSITWLPLAALLTCTFTLGHVQAQPYSALLLVTTVGCLAYGHDLSITQKKLALYLGDLSYPIYVIHMPVIFLFRAFEINVWLSILGITVSSVLLERFEKGARRRAKKNCVTPHTNDPQPNNPGAPTLPVRPDET